MDELAELDGRDGERATIAPPLRLHAVLLSPHGNGHIAAGAAGRGD